MTLVIIRAFPLSSVKCRLVETLLTCSWRKRPGALLTLSPASFSTGSKDRGMSRRPLCK